METTVADGAVLVLQVAMGISLAACTGLRAFLPLFLVSVAGRLDWLPLGGSFEWLDSWPAVIVFGAAVATEFLADKVPVVDHFLDAAQTFIKPVAGMLVMASVITELSPLQATVAGLILGGAAAGAVHATKAQVRLLSSATTAGIANPVLSLIEDAGALIGTIVSLIVPLLAFAAFVGAFVAAWIAIRRMRRSRPAV